MSTHPGPAPSRVRLAALLVACAAASGCALNIEAVNPKPNVDLPQSKRTLLLKIDESIAQDFDTPSQNGIAGAQYLGFRTSLRRGFKAAFSGSFPKPEEGKEPDLTLHLVEVEPSFKPTAVGVNRYGASTGAVAAMAMLRYKARLVDGAGNVLGRSNGTVEAKTSFTTRPEAQESVRQAMESMYEKIAAELLTGIADVPALVGPQLAPPPPPPSPAAPPPAAPPAKTKATKKK